MKHAVTMVLFRSDVALVVRTLESTLRQNRPPEQVHVLISGATPDTPLVTAVKAACHAVGAGIVCDVVVRGDNLGFAGGHNFLARRALGAGADWVTLLNPDMEIETDAFGAYWASVERYPATFAVHGPHLTSLSRGTEVVDSAGIVWTADARHFDALQGAPLSELPDRVTETDGVTGALLTVSRATHERLVAAGGEFLDELFLAYREDAELGRRMKVMGGICLVHPTRGFHHVRGARNAERTSPLQRTLGVQNRFLLHARLGSQRPGRASAALTRDVMVVAAVLIRERASRSGLRRAWSVRRYERYKGRAAEAARLSSQS